MANLEWAQVVYSTLPIMGVVVGGMATYLTQTKTLNRQLDRDIQKEREAKNIERLSVYSEILRLDGEKSLQGYFASYGYEVFDLKAFKKEFRSVFYSKFYLLDQDVAELIRKMDSLILEADFFGELGERGNSALIDSYNQVIKSIENHLEVYRTKNNQ